MAGTKLKLNKKKQLEAPPALTVYDKRRRDNLLKQLRTVARAKRLSAEDQFIWLIQKGAVWNEAVADSGLEPEEAAKIVERMLQFRMDGLAVFMLSESFLRIAMEELLSVAQSTKDEKVKLLALGKLADVSLKVLTNKPWIQKIQAFPIPAEAKEYYKGTVWDAAFEKES
jgi:hypothetical protein